MARTRRILVALIGLFAAVLIACGASNSSVDEEEQYTVATLANITFEVPAELSPTADSTDDWLAYSANDEVGVSAHVVDLPTNDEFLRKWVAEEWEYTEASIAEKQEVNVSGHLGIYTRYDSLGEVAPDATSEVLWFGDGEYLYRLQAGGKPESLVHEYYEHMQESIVFTKE